MGDAGEEVAARISAAVGKGCEPTALLHGGQVVFFPISTKFELGETAVPIGTLLS